jgi:hypothetical protein
LTEPATPGRARARTERRALDPELRGRTYAIPFDAVWEAALALARGGLPGWVLDEADDQVGVIRARATSRLLRQVADVRVRVGLDENAQTRVDLDSESRTRGPDLGGHRRRIAGFLRALDRRLAPRPGQILDQLTADSAASTRGR